MCVCRHTPVLLKLNRLSNEYTSTAFMKETQFYHHSNVLMCHWETAITHGSLGTKIVAQQTCFQCSHAQHVSNTAAVCEIGNFWQNISIFWVMQNTSHFDARLTCLSSCALYSFTFELWENKRVECVPQPLSCWHWLLLVQWVAVHDLAMTFPLPLHSSSFSGEVYNTLT